MTAADFREQHGDPTTWTTADHETYDNLRRVDDHLANNTHTCWFCHTETPTNTGYCESCADHIQTSIDRLRKLLGFAA